MIKVLGQPCVRALKLFNSAQPRACTRADRPGFFPCLTREACWAIASHGDFGLTTHKLVTTAGGPPSIPCTEIGAGH